VVVNKNILNNSISYLILAKFLIIGTCFAFDFLKFLRSQSRTNLPRYKGEQVWGKIRCKGRRHRQYVCSNRDKEEQQIRERMAQGVIGAEIFLEKI